MTLSNAPTEPLPGADDDRTRAPTLASDGAFEELFRTYHAPLCAFAYRMVRSRAVAEELVQEVFLYLWQHRETWVAHTSVRIYLYQATRNAALSYLRREKLQQRTEPVVIDLFSRPSSNSDGELVTAELERAVKRAIAKLPERCRLIYTLSREQGLTYAEIAALLEISPKTVDVQMGRAFKSLRKQLAGYLP
jgi:RNA polymerase sigma-70 factor (ECF subfamily)